MAAATPPLTAPNPWTIRPFAAVDRASVLRLNAEARPAAAAFEDSEVTELLKFKGHHFVAVNQGGSVVGYLLSFLRESDYDDTEICALRRQLSEPFVYICQIVIAPELRRQQIGRALYQKVEATAQEYGVRLSCCD